MEKVIEQKEKKTIFALEEKMKGFEKGFIVVKTQEKKLNDIEQNLQRQGKENKILSETVNKLKTSNEKKSSNMPNVTFLHPQRWV